MTPQEFENIVMSEYPHIYQEMKNVATHRQERDLTMIDDSMKRAKKNGDLHGSVDIETFMNMTRKRIESSKCTEIDNHDIVPLSQMFEEMKEKLPLEELLDNFDIEDETKKDNNQGEDSDSSEVQFDDVVSIGLEKMYSQFQGRDLLSQTSTRTSKTRWTCRLKSTSLVSAIKEATSES